MLKPSPYGSASPADDQPGARDEDNKCVHLIWADDAASATVLSRIFLPDAHLTEIGPKSTIRIEDIS